LFLKNKIIDKAWHLFFKSLRLKNDLNYYLENQENQDVPIFLQSGCTIKKPFNFLKGFFALCKAFRCVQSVQ